MTTATTLRTAATLALAALVLVACSKSADKPPAIPRAKLVSEVAAEQQAAAAKTQTPEPQQPAEPAAAEPPAPFTPEHWAEGLKAASSTLAQEGFNPTAMTCAPHTDKDDGTWIMRCRTLLTDGERGNKSAILDFELYDQDMSFEPLDTPVRQHIEALKGSWVIKSNPDITMDIKKTGAHLTFETACHQSLGADNSPAYCTLLYNPRVFIIAGVKPDLASTSKVVTGGDNRTNSMRDVHHASDLSFLGLVTAQAVK